MSLRQTTPPSPPSAAVSVENAELSTVGNDAHDVTCRRCSALLEYVQHKATCQSLMTCTCSHRYREHLWNGEKCVHNPVSCQCEAFTGVECSCGLFALAAPEAKGMREDAP